MSSWALNVNWWEKKLRNCLKLSAIFTMVFQIAAADAHITMQVCQIGRSATVVGNLIARVLEKIGGIVYAWEEHQSKIAKTWIMCQSVFFSLFWHTEGWTAEEWSFGGRSFEKCSRFSQPVDHRAWCYDVTWRVHKRRMAWAGCRESGATWRMSLQKLNSARLEEYHSKTSVDYVVSCEAVKDTIASATICQHEKWKVGKNCRHESCHDTSEESCPLRKESSAELEESVNFSGRKQNKEQANKRQDAKK